MAEMEAEEISQNAPGQFYCRYVIGHEDEVFGREFLEFEISSDGMLRYANESQYRHSEKIRKEVRV